MPPATPNSPRPAWSRKSQSDQARTSADVARESARATQAAIESAKAALESDRLRGGSRQAQPRLLRDPLAPLRTHRQPAGARRQSGQGQRRAAGGDPPGVARSSSTSTCRSSTSPPSAASAPAASSPSASSRRTIPTARASGHLSVIDNTVDTTTGTIHLKATFDNTDGIALARPVRHRRAHPRYHAERHRGPRRSRAGRPAGPVRLRGEGRTTPWNRAWSPWAAPSARRW